MEKAYPLKGDYIWVSFDPSEGHEQKGRRPAIVVSSRHLNKSGLVWALPITNTTDGKFRIVLPEGEAVRGAVLFTQIRTLDLESRPFTIAGAASDAVLEEVIGKADAILISD